MCEREKFDGKLCEISVKNLQEKKMPISHNVPIHSQSKNAKLFSISNNFFYLEKYIIKLNLRNNKLINCYCKPK
jgi:hypothetical protein